MTASPSTTPTSSPTPDRSPTATFRRSLRVYRVILGLAFEAARGKATTLFAAAALYGILGAIGGLVTKMVVDALAGGHPGRAMGVGVAYLVLTALAALADDVSNLVQSDLGEQTSQAVEQKLMAVSSSAAGLEHLERPEFADKVKLVRDRSFLPYFAFTNLNSFASIIFGLAAAVVLLGTVHPLLVLLPVVVGPGVVLQFNNYRRHFARHDSVALDERLARHYLQLATEPAAAKEIRLFGLGPHLIERHRVLTGTYNTMLFRDQLRRTWAGMAAGSLYGAGLAATIGFVGWLALDGRATFGDVALTVQVARMAIGQVQSAARQAAWLAELAFTGERYLWLLEYEPTVVAKPPGQAVPAPARVEEGIVFEHVSFTYPGTDEVVLDDVSLRLAPHSTVALVGENGAGKTSLVKLLCRFYDPTGGRITVDGVDLRDLDLDGWRAGTGAAFQDFVHFQLVAQEAVGVGDLPAIDDLVRVGSSARQAGADRVIDRLPAGLSTQLGRWFEGGVDLSEGEWQRVALARGLMRPSPALLVLDEPTASLDPRAEHEVFATFAAMSRRSADGRSPITILVSHRFSTVRMADVIVVLHDGRIEEQGSHEELLAAGGRYAELFRLQASRY
ncbi:MAG TPA: ABC transporter ATP-binding protein [Acidimicrobiales bacterium]|nr:ABC transporter ATP-binding protein [Acidimicrobiales bacterium]